MPTEKPEDESLLTQGVAQEIGNLLTFVLGEVSLLRGSVTEAERNVWIAEMDSKLLRASELNRLLLSHLEDAPAEPHPVDLNELARSVQDLLVSEEHLERKIRLLRAATLPKVQAVPSQIRQMLKSLVTSAASHHAMGDIWIRTGAQWLLEDQLAEDPIGSGLPTGEYVYCEVIVGPELVDTPISLTPGLDPSILKDGLELAALIGIVRSNRGMIAWGKTAEASIVRVYLPTAEVEAPKPGMQSSAVHHEWHGSGTALFVDDEESVRMLGERLLDAFGYDVVTATDGRDGIQKFRQLIDRVELVVLDVTMPYLNGLEAFQEIRKLKPGIPVLFISGYANAVDERSLDERAAFLAKPFRMAEMRAKIQQIAEANP